MIELLAVKYDGDIEYLHDIKTIKSWYKKIALAMVEFKMKMFLIPDLVQHFLHLYF
ncbi:Uncharacterised protein [Chlamydia abortus]|nr:Uncharacterised protein [Chlamydia abortus]SGA31945.1 Uncharacterised protein [Chlamydia abortus]SGA31975.1 Uncharacterised protein [Chlamydia abortus]SHE15057.1 Uncharacterised protein [Chlamydia abortus]